MKRNYKLNSLEANHISGESITKIENSIRSSFANESVYNQAIDRILDEKLNLLNNVQAEQIIIKNSINDEVVFKSENGLSSFLNGLNVSGDFLTIGSGLDVRNGQTLLKTVITDGNITITNGSLTTPQINCTNASIRNIVDLTKINTVELDVTKLGKTSFGQIYDFDPYIQFNGGDIQINKTIVPFDNEIKIQGGNDVDDLYFRIRKDDIKIGNVTNSFQLSANSLYVTNNSTTFSGNVYINGNDFQCKLLECDSLKVDGVSITGNSGGTPAPDTSETVAALIQQVKDLTTRIESLEGSMDTDYMNSTLSKVNGLEESIASIQTTSNLNFVKLDGSSGTLGELENRVLILEDE